MKFEKVNDTAIVNKLFRITKNQRILMDLHNDPDFEVVKVYFGPDEYASLRSAQSSLSSCAKRLGIPIKAHIIGGELYLCRESK